MTIPTAKIQIHIRPGLWRKKADWDRFSDLLENLVPADLHHASLEAIDEEIERVTSGIRRAVKECIPVIKYRVLPAPFPTDRIRDMESEAQ